MLFIFSKLFYIELTLIYNFAMNSERLTMLVAHSSVLTA